MTAVLRIIRTSIFSNTVELNASGSISNIEFLSLIFNSIILNGIIISMLNQFDLILFGKYSQFNKFSLTTVEL